MIPQAGSCPVDCDSFLKVISVFLFWIDMESLLAFVVILLIQKHYEKWWNEAWNYLIPHSGTQ